jgi:hypothetical protein
MVGSRLLFLVAVVASPCMAAAVTFDDPDGFATVEICSDDTPETAAAFLRSTKHLLSESKIRLQIRCPSALTADKGPIMASFIVDDEGIAMQLVSPAENQSSRRIPWLKKVKRPLQDTLAARKGTTLVLLLESLAMDLEDVRLRLLPMPASANHTSSIAVESPLLSPSIERGTVTSAPTEVVAAPRTEVAVPIESVKAPAKDSVPKPVIKPTSVPVPSSPPPSPVADSAKQNKAMTPTALEIALPLAGMVWMPPSTIAPQIEAGLGWGGPRWWGIVHGALQLDSSFAIAGRGFYTTGYTGRLGLRRMMVLTKRFRWDAEATAVGHLNRYRRDDIPNAETRSWFDVGAGVHSRVVFRFTRHMNALLSIGVQAFPTSRLASIPEGPSRRVNLTTLSAVGGFSFDL